MERLHSENMQEVSAVRFGLRHCFWPANHRTFPFHYLVDYEYGWNDIVQLAKDSNGETDVNKHKPLKNNGMVHFSPTYRLGNHIDLF